MWTVVAAQTVTRLTAGVRHLVGVELGLCSFTTETRKREARTLEHEEKRNVRVFSMFSLATRYAHTHTHTHTQHTQLDRKTHNHFMMQGESYTHTHAPPPTNASPLEFPFHSTPHTPTTNQR
jgi:hypothetical protein